MNIKQLNEEFEAMELYEMSMAFHYRNRRIDVCAWVENPMVVDNRYFKYYNSATINSATKVARIRIDKPQYVGGIYKERNLQKWVLTKKEVKELYNLLQTPSDDYDGLTKWQDILVTYNRDNFLLSVKDSIAGNFEKVQKDPKMPKYIEPFTINYPMPNYLELEE